MRQRILFIAVALVLVAGIVIRRYGQLRVEFDNTRFFTNAGIALSLATRDEVNAPSAPRSDELRNFEYNPLPRLHAMYPETLKKSLIDPFFPTALSDRYLLTSFGYVEHAEWTPPESPWRNKPVWFVWGCGIAQVAPTMVEEASGEFRRYRFQSSPYQPSNGLSSEGYLYLDSVGNRLGKIR